MVHGKKISFLKIYLDKSTSVLSVCSHKNKSNVQRSHRTVILLLLFYYIYMLLYWCWDGLGARGEGDDRGWDGWMAWLTRWTWVWVNSASWWWTGRPGVLQFMGLQRGGHDWVTDLIWSDIYYYILLYITIYRYTCIYFTTTIYYSTYYIEYNLLYNLYISLQDYFAF